MFTAAFLVYSLSMWSIDSSCTRSAEYRKIVWLKRKDLKRYRLPRNTVARGELKLNIPARVCIRQNQEGINIESCRYHSVPAVLDGSGIFMFYSSEQVEHSLRGMGG